MPTPTHRHPRRAPRAVALACLATFAAIAWGGTAFAQIGDSGQPGDPGIPSCPPPAWCDPDPRSNPDPMMDTADAWGQEMNRRRLAGDCTGLGPQGCLSLLLIQVMCAIDGREWVQEFACKGTAGQALPVASADDPETSAWLVDQLRMDGISGLTRIALEDRATLGLTVTDRFRDGDGRVMAFVEAVDSIDRRTILMAIGTDGLRIYVAELEALYEASR